MLILVQKIKEQDQAICFKTHFRKVVNYITSNNISLKHENQDILLKYHG